MSLILSKEYFRKDQSVCLSIVQSIPKPLDGLTDTFKGIDLTKGYQSAPFLRAGGLRIFNCQFD